MSQKPIDYMIEALTLEVAAIRQRSNVSRIELRGGERVGEADGNVLYRFPFVEDPYLRDDTPVRVTCGQQEVDGTLVSVGEGHLLVALEEDIGQRVSSAQLTIDNSFLIERLRTKLEEVTKGEAQLNGTLANRMIGRGNIRSSEKEPDPSVFQGSQLNNEQRQAVRRSLGSDIAFIWGPPGTGKTTTLARIVEAHYRAGRSVLLVSNTNIAVDTALEKIAERLVTDPAFHQGAVLRVGALTSDQLREDYGEQVILEEVVARLGKDLEHRKRDIQAQIEDHERKARPLRIAIRELEEVDNLREQLSENEQALSQEKQRYRDLERRVKERATELEKSRRDLQRAQSMGSIRRLVSGMHPERLSQKIAALEVSHQGSKGALRASEQAASTLESNIQAVRLRVSDVDGRLSNYPDLGECRGQLDSVEKTLGSLRETAQSIENELKALEDRVLKNCCIVATTVYRTFLNSQLSRDFDVVVIDEASMLMLPMAFYAAGLAQTAVTVAGDFRQLPSIVLSDDELAGEWLQKDVFTKIGIPGSVQSGRLPDYFIALRDQYRMRPEICDTVNELFYPDFPLRTAGEAQNRPKVACSIGTEPLLYVDTTSHHPWSATRLGSYSRYNLFHALVISDLVLQIGSTSVGVTTPYAAQTRLVRALLSDRLGDVGNDLAATVHSFQGNERGTMVVDLPDSMGSPLGRFMKATERDDDGNRLLNVALSRPRDRLVLVANFEFLRTKAPTAGTVQRVLDHFENYGERVELDDLLQDGGMDWLDGLQHLGATEFDLPQETALFTEGSFFPAFLRDLAQVESSIVIFSPFLTARGVARWVDYFRAAIARGASVRLVTRPPGDQGGVLEEGLADTISEIQKLDVVVDMRSRMHEKIAVIDGSILWHGSLNVLSHKDTTEFMSRIPSRSMCQELARFVTASARSRGDAPDLSKPENPACPKCGSVTVWKNGKYGVYYDCFARCGGKVDASGRRRQPSNRAQRGRRSGAVSSGGAQPCPEPGCNGKLIERNGRYGSFLGCTNYPRCRHTQSIAEA